MAAVTPRRSSRIPHVHTPKMSERKKGLFQDNTIVPTESLTQHRRLPVLDSESESDCDLGIISALDSSSSGDEFLDGSIMKTPQRNKGYEAKKKFLKENNELKNFLKSPFTLKKYQTQSLSTPGTPHVNYQPTTPSSSHSCNSVHTTSSGHSRARKSLASLIADTESCSSSLKDLNFDSDSNLDSKENTPKTRKSKRLQMAKTSFKGVLKEQKGNTELPGTMPFAYLTKLDQSPTQMLKTPQNNTDTLSPPKINRKSIVEIEESPDSCDNDKSHKRLANESLPNPPNSKQPKLDIPRKSRLSLFSTDSLKEILSTKSFYGKSTNTTIPVKVSPIVRQETFKRSVPNHKRKSRKPGQINMGVKHKIRKPKVNKNALVYRSRFDADRNLDESAAENNSSVNSQDTSQEIDADKVDPFVSEKQTIDALLSQWTEEEEPPLEVPKPDSNECMGRSCGKNQRVWSPTAITHLLEVFTKTVMEETDQVFQPMAVQVVANEVMPNSEVLIEIGAKNNETQNDDVPMSEEPKHSSDHGTAPKGYLPVEGGYILVDEQQTAQEEEIPDLDEIERELRMLDEQILKMAESNNMNAEAVIASTENVQDKTSKEESTGAKLFPIFSNPNSGTSTANNNKTPNDKKKSILKSVAGQYVIDAGQKRFGITQCNECGVIYEIGDPQDEHDHLVHHNATDVLKYNGTKDEVVVGSWPGGRCVCIRGSDTHWKKIENLLSRVIHPQLGYEGKLPGDRVYAYTAYIYIEKKQIVGCLIVEPKAKAYKLLPGDPDCCSVESYPVKCGISRIWTHLNCRGRHIASRMLDCARATFLYGQAMKVEEISFSAPTTAGKAFATKYCSTESFYVYLD